MLSDETAAALCLVPNAH